MKVLKLTSFVILALSMLNITGCKKGEEDPGLSLRSRKARAEGEWKVTSGEYSSTQEDESDNDGSVTTTSTSEYNNDMVIATTTTTYENYHMTTYSTTYPYETVEVDSTGTSTSTDTSYSSINYSIDKEGTFEMVEMRDMDPEDQDYTEETYTGTWNFTGGVGDVKNKEQILFTITEKKTIAYSGSNTTTNTDEDYYDTQLWNIVRLANDEMIIRQEGTDMVPDGYVQYTLNQ